MEIFYYLNKICNIYIIHLIYLYFMHSLLCFIFDALKNLLNIPLIIIKYLFFYFNIYMSLRDRYKDGQVLGGIISFYLDVRNKTVCRNKRV